MIRVVTHMVARKNPLHKSLGRVGISDSDLSPPTATTFHHFSFLVHIIIVWENILNILHNTSKLTHIKSAFTLGVRDSGVESTNTILII
jgi:hypothetical protein